MLRLGPSAPGCIMFSVSASLFSQSESYFQQFQSRVAPGAAGQDAPVASSLNQGLKKGLGVELDEQAVKPTPKGFDIDKVVDTVMQFVESRIVGARADGASDEELEGMFSAARKGVEQGFSEAREQIIALEKMNEPLADSIDTAENRIYQGVDKLEGRLLGPEPGITGSTLSPESVKTSRSENLDSRTERESGAVGSTGRDDTPALKRFSYLEARREQSETFSFQLTTQDGDTVDISAFYNQSFSVESARIRGESGAAKYAAFDFRQSGGFDLVIQGSLDEDEKRAIADLLTQVDALATEFYQGDLQTAFQMAMELTSDPDEIAQFSLNLQQQQLSAIEYGTYRSGPRAYAQPALPRGLSEPLAEFAQGVREAFNDAERFDRPAKLLEGLFEQFDVNREMSKLTSPLLALLESNSAARTA